MAEHTPSPRSATRSATPPGPRAPSRRRPASPWHGASARVWLLTLFDLELVLGRHASSPGRGSPFRPPRRRTRLPERDQDAASGPHDHKHQGFVRSFLRGGRRTAQGTGVNCGRPRLPSAFLTGTTSVPKESQARSRAGQSCRALGVRDAVRVARQPRLTQSEQASGPWAS